MYQVLMKQGVKGKFNELTVAKMLSTRIIIPFFVFQGIYIIHHYVGCHSGTHFA